MGYDSFLRRMPSGIPGVRSRGENSTVDQLPYGATPFPAYGIPIIDSSGTAIPVGAGATAAQIKGLLLKPFPSTGGVPGAALFSAVPPTAGIADRLRRGFATVLCLAGTPAQDGQVYVRTANASGAKIVGGIEAAADNSVTSPAIVGTGTGTIAATIGTGLAPTAGTWVVKVLTTSNTSFLSVTDPNGTAFPQGQIGVAYKSGTGFNFTVTAAGTMTAGDTFSPVVTENTIAPDRWFFTNAGDASGNVEIEIRI